MATASSTDSATGKRKARKMPTTVKRELAQRKKTKSSKQATPMRAVFIPGSLNDQLSKLDVGETFTKSRRIPTGAAANPELAKESQQFFKAQNSILSAGIAKVRGRIDHNHKRFTMERGQYMTAGNDALFVFLSVTRME